MRLHWCAGRLLSTRPYTLSKRIRFNPDYETADLTATHLGAYRIWDTKQWSYSLEIVLG